MMPGYVDRVFPVFSDALRQTPQDTAVESSS